MGAQPATMAFKPKAYSYHSPREQVTSNQSHLQSHEQQKPFHSNQVTYTTTTAGKTVYGRKYPIHSPTRYKSGQTPNIPNTIPIAQLKPQSTISQNTENYRVSNFPVQIVKSSSHPKKSFTQVKPAEPKVVKSVQSANITINKPKKTEDNLKTPVQKSAFVKRFTNETKKPLELKNIENKIYHKPVKIISNHKKKEITSNNEKAGENITKKAEDKKSVNKREETKIIKANNMTEKNPAKLKLVVMKKTEAEKPVKKLVRKHSKPNVDNQKTTRKKAKKKQKERSTKNGKSTNKTKRLLSQFKSNKDAMSNVEKKKPRTPKSTSISEKRFTFKSQMSIKSHSKRQNRLKQQMKQFNKIKSQKSRKVKTSNSRETTQKKLRSLKTNKDGKKTKKTKNKLKNFKDFLNKTSPIRNMRSIDFRNQIRLDKASSKKAKEKDLFSKTFSSIASQSKFKQVLNDRRRKYKMRSMEYQKEHDQLSRTLQNIQDNLKGIDSIQRYSIRNKTTKSLTKKYKTFFQPSVNEDDEKKEPITEQENKEANSLPHQNCTLKTAKAIKNTPEQNDVWNVPFHQNQKEKLIPSLIEEPNPVPKTLYLMQESQVKVTQETQKETGLAPNVGDKKSTIGHTDTQEHLDPELVENYHSNVTSLKNIYQSIGKIKALVKKNATSILKPEIIDESDLSKPYTRPFTALNQSQKC